MDNKTTQATLIRKSTKEGPTSSDPLRTTETVGFYVDKPKEGVQFMFFSEPLESSSSMRIINTSMVQTVKEDIDQIEFTTLNSSYLLQIVPKAMA